MFILRLLKSFLALGFLAAAAAGATYWRYESLSPCEWMVQDLMQESEWPELAVRSRVRAEFLLEGVTAPDAGQCLLKWWSLRRDGLGQP